MSGGASEPGLTRRPERDKTSADISIYYRLALLRPLLVFE